MSMNSGDNDNDNDNDNGNLSGNSIFQEEDESLSYAELLANLALNEELIIIIPVEEEERTKNGLKNLKSKQNNKLRDEGLPIPDEVLEFSSTPSNEYEDCVNLRILLRRKGMVRVKKMIIPDGSL